jgi:hypothetical protein
LVAGAEVHVRALVVRERRRWALGKRTSRMDGAGFVTCRLFVAGYVLVVLPRDLVPRGSGVVRCITAPLFAVLSLRLRLCAASLRKVGLYVVRKCMCVCAILLLKQ